MRTIIALATLSLLALAQDPEPTSLTIRMYDDLVTWAMAPASYNEVVLANDLDLADKPLLTPIGTVTEGETPTCTPWAGTFDGQGFALQNMKISSLFCGVADGTIIKNLQIVAGTFDQAVIVPTLEGSLTILNVKLDEETTIGKDDDTVESAAGLVGTVNLEEKKLLIHRVTMGAQIVAKNSVAGLVGTITTGYVEIVATEVASAMKLTQSEATETPAAYGFVGGEIPEGVTVVVKMSKVSDKTVLTSVEGVTPSKYAISTKVGEIENVAVLVTGWTFPTLPSEPEPTNLFAVEQTAKWTAMTKDENNVYTYSKSADPQEQAKVATALNAMLYETETIEKESYKMFADNLAMSDFNIVTVVEKYAAPEEPNPETRQDSPMNITALYLVAQGKQFADAVSADEKQFDVEKYYINGYDTVFTELFVVKETVVEDSCRIILSVKVTLQEPPEPQEDPDTPDVPDTREDPQPPKHMIYYVPVRAKFEIIEDLLKQEHGDCKYTMEKEEGGEKKVVDVDFTEEAVSGEDKTWTIDCSEPAVSSSSSSEESSSSSSSVESSSSSSSVESSSSSVESSSSSSFASSSSSSSSEESSSSSVESSSSSSSVASSSSSRHSSSSSSSIRASSSSSKQSNISSSLSSLSFSSDNSTNGAARNTISLLVAVFLAALLM